jgi:hypothetical protein
MNSIVQVVRYLATNRKFCSSNSKYDDYDNNIT